MKQKTDICRGFVGRWKSADPLLEDVEHHISTSKGEYKISVIDTYDGEKAEVYDIQWDGDHLRYKLHWKSTGRFIKYSLTLLDKGKIGMSFEYSAQDILVKKPTTKSKQA